MQYPIQFYSTKLMINNTIIILVMFVVCWLVGKSKSRSVWKPKNQCYSISKINTNVSMAEYHISTGAKHLEQFTGAKSRENLE